MSKLPLHPEICFVGETTFRNARQRFGIKRDDRRRHMYLVGKTGMGKSTMIENLVIQDIYNGHGLALIDPHGDLVEKVLKFIPDHRIEDVIYFNPSDKDFPIAFNVLETSKADDKSQVASGLVGVFKKIWAESWGPRLEYLLRNSIQSILDTPGESLMGITRMFVDNDYRKKVVANVQDPVLKAFWADEFSKFNQQFMTEAIAPIQNKVGQFLSNSIIRNVVGQSKSAINIRQAMDEQKIILLNLSKGRIGEDSSALLGAMMITQIQLAAMSRVDIEEDTRKDFYLYVDEFQNFATDSFANILSEARKYRLNLIIAHQYIEQLGDVVKAAVFGNVGTMVVYRIGAADAAELIKEFEPYYMEEDLVNIPKYNAYTKLMIDGISSTPFSCMGLPPMSGTTGNVEKVIDYSRKTYASTKEEVETEIRTWSGQATPAEEEVKDDEKRRKKRNKKKVKKIEKLLPEYEKLAKLGNTDAQSIVNQLHQATKDLLDNKDVDIGDIIGRDEDTEKKDTSEKPAEKKPAEEKPVKKKEKTWSDVLQEQKDNPQPKEETKLKKDKPKKSKPKGEFEITCDDCGEKDHINFKHDPNKPILCGDCLKKKRAEKNQKPKGKPKEETVSLREVQDKSVSLTHGQPVQLDDDKS